MAFIPEELRPFASAPKSLGHHTGPEDPARPAPAPGYRLSASAPKGFRFPAAPCKPLRMKENSKTIRTRASLRGPLRIASVRKNLCEMGSVANLFPVGKKIAPQHENFLGITC